MEMRKTASGKKKILPLMKKFYGDRFEGLDIDDFLKRVDTEPIEDIFYFKVGSYSKFTPQKVDEWMDELGLKSQSKVLIPADQLVDWDEVKETLGEEEAEKLKKEKAGQYQEVKKPLQAGYMTLERLYHIPSYSNKVSSSMFYKDVNPKSGMPLMGRGKYRITGQKIGEMELSALLSKGARDFIASSRKESAQEDNQVFLNNLLALGLAVRDDRGYNVGGSDLKNNLEKMKAKFRLKNNK